jgi:plasmid stabilization system protein ParE
MTLRLVFHPAARAELREAQGWYEARVPGLGLEFARAVEAALMAIQRSPAAYPVVYEEVRQAVLRRFPYSLLFIPEADSILVVACFHHRRDPRTWQERA